MTVSGRVPLVLLGGLLPVLLWPGVGTVILFSCLVAAVCAVDLLLSTPINQFAVERQALLITRLGESCNSCISLTNLSKRRSDIEVRDAWPPSAGITATPVRLVLATAATSQIVTSLHPTKRGETVAGPVVLRSWGPLGLAARQRSISLASRLRVLPAFASHRHLPSRLARLRLFD
ncbi:MAG: hypothetical protein LBG70_01605, partial [Bifidobacteriaceae bacterium]|nr:hypothetical protein [Bifidobacteriaceae bacterium]